VKNSSEKSNRDRYVFLWASSVIARLLSPIARELKNHHNIKTILFAYGEINIPNPRYVDFDRSDFEKIVNVTDLMAPRTTDLPNNAEIADQAAALENRLKVNIVDLIRTDRHLGIDFVSGAKFHRSYYGESVNYRQSLDIALRLCKAFEEFLTQYRPITAWVFPGSIATAALASTANGMNIPWRWLAPSPKGNLFYWCEDQNVRPIGFQAAFDRRFEKLREVQNKVGEDIIHTGDRDTTPARAKAFFESTHRRTTLKYLANQFYRTLRTDLGHRVRRPGLTIYGRYKPLELLRQTTERWFWLRRELKQAPDTPGIPDGTPFVFYPLHIEPESTLMVEAQHADNQLLVVDWLAKTAPPGWYVVVKEHPGATSPRPKGFWRLVRAYPNVIVAATFEDAMSLVNRSRAVADINGSVGQQAAAIGKPVVAFNKSFIATVMPHVFGVASYDEAREAFGKIRDNDLPDFDTRLLAAQAFDQATNDCCLPVTDKALVAGIPGKSSANSNEVSRFVQSMLASLPNFLSEI